MTKKEYTEKAATIAAIVYPLTAVPQAIKIFSSQSAGDLSLLSWVGFMVLELVFLAYGVVHKLNPIIITGVLWTILYTLIIFGIIMYS